LPGYFGLYPRGLLDDEEQKRRMMQMQQPQPDPTSPAAQAASINALPQGLLNPTAAPEVFLPPAPAKGTLQTYNPTPAERAMDWINQQLGIERTAGSPGEFLTRGVEQSTPVGLLSSAYNVGKDIGTSAAQTSVKGMPAVEPLETAALTAAMAVAPAVRGKKIPKPKAASISKMLDIRDMSPAEALTVAKTERHLVQEPSGQYVGAPLGVKTPEQIQAIRDNFDHLVDQGASGGDWYTRAGEWIRQVTGGEPAKINRLSQELALTSAQAAPDTNLAFALQGHNALELTGQTPPIVRTGAQARSMQKSFETGEPIKLGKKTGIYEGHMNPLKQGGPTGTNDIWHARAFGYIDENGKPWSKSLSPNQHAFIDHETVLAADRANQRAAGGRTDWTAAEVQAAPWVAAKGASLPQRFPKRFPTAEAGIAEASRTYPDYAPAFAASATHEATPGAGTGHLPGLLNEPYNVRQAFSADPRSGWRTPTGNDLLYSAAGIYNEPTRAATGYFQPHTGPLEMNPAEVARPLVAPAQDKLGTTIHPRDQALLNAVEGVRGYADVQNMGAWHQTTSRAKVSSQGAIYIPFDRALSPDEMTRLAQVAQQRGLGVSDTGQGVTLMDFSPDASGQKAAQMLKGGLEADISAILPGAQAERRRLISGNVDYEQAFQRPGTGAATGQLKDVLDVPQLPDLMRKLDQDPAIRQKMLDLNARDIEVGNRTGMPVRQDVLRARQIVAEQGFQGLFRAWKLDPKAFPAVAGLLLGGSQLPGLLSEGSQTGAGAR
jgi:hypothetical protein